ncbi:MAG: hypothetical protein PWQ31_648 [Eubacteriales bacterium]|nr:hypothetical protein [Eubacteriales bacterium]
MGEAIFAVIADLHGNLPALEAVLADIRRRGVARIYCAGDLVGYGPWPNEVIERVREENILTVLGNYDDAVAWLRPVCGCDYPDEKSRVIGEHSLLWTAREVWEENVAWLRQLPASLRWQEGKREVLLVHGSPRSLNEYLLPEKGPDFFQEIKTQAGADILIAGHTHRPYHLRLEEVNIINAGSVGRPKHGNPNATYVLITVGEQVKVDIIEVPYDVERTAAQIVKAGLPPELADFLRRGGW